MYASSVDLHDLEAQQDVDAGAAWASPEAMTTLEPQPQPRPNDECDTLWIDRTSLDIAFDRSCFDALDEQLLHHPVSSFADVCWADAVGNDPAPHGDEDLDYDRPLELEAGANELELDADADVEGEAPSDWARFADRLTQPFALDEPNLPFTDKLNTPDDRDAAPAPHTHFHFSPNAKPPPPYPYPHPHFSTLSLGVSNPSEAIGFFPTRPRRTPRRSFSFLAAFRVGTYFPRDARHGARM
ncbi:hypothetical protein B0H17DRAFT_1129442 [Mycena rosella]|uniref:Uncharacterized protein n=1 Tax=Mycena rosella TaxID=1033263 RepID=A0AAD7GKE7_MYCRO|nr:hypothetical protein B0H17DRAFT_1129442 [Mycena rosella]